MNANLTKLISSAAAVLAVGGSAFAQTTPKTCPPSPFEQGYGISNDKFPAAYNAAARVDVQNSWDVFMTASFLYWYADQEGMDIAYPTTNTGTVLTPYDVNYVTQKFEFKPGFKVGMGVNFDFDNWVASVEYTWFHQSTLLGSIQPPTDARGGTAVYAMSSWYNNLAGTVYATNVVSKWRCNIDIADAVMSRPYYQGRKLTILPFGGVRGAFIRQNMRLDATTYPAVDIAIPRVSHNHSNSWAVGPRAGFQGHWLLGCGFRMEGDVAGSVLYTRYTSVGHREDTGTNDTTSWVGYDDYNTMRPMVDMGIGFAWGSYFDRQNYHLDLLATYDFNAMWGQNMMRALNNTYYTSSAWEAPDLHVQGLTFTARFDF